MLITGSNAVFAYSESTEEHTYAGSTRMDCYLEMDNFSAKASLETSDDSRVDINAVSDVVVVYGNKLHDIPHQSDKKRLLF